MKTIDNITIESSIRRRENIFVKLSKTELRESWKRRIEKHLYVTRLEGFLFEKRIDYYPHQFKTFFHEGWKKTINCSLLLSTDAIFIFTRQSAQPQLLIKNAMYLLKLKKK